MTRINQRDDDAYYDAYDEDIVAGRVKPVRTARRTNPGARVGDDELDAIFRGRPGERSPGPTAPPPPSRRRAVPGPARALQSRHRRGPRRIRQGARHHHKCSHPRRRREVPRQRLSRLNRSGFDGGGDDGRDHRHGTR